MTPLSRPVHLVDATLPTLAANLALDEALLVQAEDRGGPAVLRFWEAPALAVVLGASSRLRDDVHLDACHADGVAIARRSSGGGTVVIGPGALNLAVVLPLNIAPGLEAVDVAQRFVLERLAVALGPPVEVQGLGDLTVHGRKCAGSAQRRLRRHFLVHVSLLYDFPLHVISRYLAHPRRQPAYRSGRPHADFVVNLNLPRDSIVAAVSAVWLPPAAPAVSAPVPTDLVEELAATRFADPGWIERF